ncbi:MAG: NYN domain-containing protein [Candidatus Paceibacterota bacterium]
MVSSQVQNARSGVFIDASNIFWGAREADFRIDFTKLKEYLDARFSPTFLNYYCCEDENPSTPEFARRAEGQKDFHNLLEGIGYSVIRKPLKHIKGGGTKCDVDVDIAVDLRNYEDDIDCIILFSGDSDYLPMVEYYWKAGKFIRIFSYEELLSWELKTFGIKHPRCNYKILNEIRSEIEFKN